MNNQRDELAKLLFIADNHAAKWGEREWELLKEDSRNMQYVYDMADAILAAGFTRPRTVSTVEELDALPVGSVVLSDVYRHAVVDELQIAFQRWSDGMWHRGARCGDTHPDNFLPASVLYEPEGK